MLDGWARRRIDPTINVMAARLAAGGASADAITLTAFAMGIAAAAAIASGYFLVALVLILASRLGDGLDGAVARISGVTDRGGYLDIVLDFVFYGAVPVAFVLVDPQANAVAGAILVFSFYVNGASFLAFAVMAEKRKLSTARRGRKSIFFTTGLAEATETLAFFVVMCLFPHWFPALALVFALMCFYTALSRVVLAWESFE